MRSLKREELVTAQDIARRKGYTELALLLEPKIHHPISKEILDKLEHHVHQLMKTAAGNMVL